MPRKKKPVVSSGPEVGTRHVVIYNQNHEEIESQFFEQEDFEKAYDLYEKKKKAGYWVEMFVFRGWEFIAGCNFPNGAKFRPHD